MLSEKDILELQQQVVAVIKAQSQNKGNLKDNKLPEYNPVYVECVQLANDIKVHSEIGVFPDALFKAKAPNEDEGQWKYRKENYRPVTMPFWNRALSTFNRIWNDQNYAISWKGTEEEKGKEVRDYFEREYPFFNSIINYFRSVVTKGKANDPNSLLVVKPYTLPLIETEEGEYIVDDSQRIEPIACIYTSPKVIRFEPGQYAMIELPEKSMVTDGNNKVQEGLIYEIFDDKNIYRLTQTGKKSDFIFNLAIYYAHNLGYVPCWKLKGYPIDRDGNTLYKSVFYDAVPLLDEALYDASTLSISKVGAAFPMRWAVIEPCDYQGCNGSGKIFGDERDAEGTPIQVQCPSCKGSGSKPIFTPMGVVQVKPGTATSEQTPTPPMGFVEPQLGSLTFMRAEIETTIQKAFAMLNIDIANQPSGGEMKTATGKLIDREELFTFISQYSNELFDLLTNAIKAIGGMRYPDGFEMPEISQPISFSMRNENDLNDEIAAANTTNSPEIVKRKLIGEYVEVRFTNSAEMLAVNDIVMEVDAMSMMNNTEIIAAVGSGLFAKWQSTLHYNIYSYINELMDEDATFRDKSMKDKKAILIERAKADALELNSGFSADKILSIA